MKHLIVPDPHCVFGLDNDRLDAVGQFVLEERPDVIIVLGDWFDLSSLRRDERGTLTFEGEAYLQDIAWGRDGMRTFLRPMREYNERMIAQKGKQYKPRKVFCNGNHEDRITRAVNERPDLRGLMGMHDLCVEEDGWEFVPFKQSIEIDGIGYSHYFTSGVSGRPISGEHIGASLCNKCHRSCVQGHSHLFDHAERSDRTGQKLFGLSAGCLSHPAYSAGWCRDTVHLWWRGVVVLDDLDGEGYYNELRAVTLRKLMRERN